jgi:hypothetical protein
MGHQRHYTLEQANAARAWVAERGLVALGPRARQGVDALDTATGGSYPGRDVAQPLVELSQALSELEAVDIVLRDFQRGLVDFPSLRSRMTSDPRIQARQDAERAAGASEEVYLCWLVDEDDAIGFWHEPEAGFAGRRPL